MADDELLLPEGSLLLHIGPYKTGTTAIQSALRQGQDRLRQLGVAHVGLERRRVRQAILSVTNRHGLIGDKPPSRTEWQRLVRNVHHAEQPRSVLSSEFFSDARMAAVEEIVDGFGRDRLRVVVTLRPLGKILPSAWQQYVRNQLTVPYDDWLEAMFNRPPYRVPTASFWHRHRHDKLVRKWVRAVGADRVTVVVVDDRDRAVLTGAFERMLGVPTGTLVPVGTVTNRSLTAAEIELVRRLNLEFEANNWSAEVYHAYVRNGVVWKMLRRVPAPDEPRIITPGWALDRAAEAAAAAASGIRDLGVRVVGDLDQLSRVEQPAATAPGSVELPVQLGSDVVVALLVGCGLVDPPGGDADGAVARWLAEGTAPDTGARLVLRRLRRAAGRRRAFDAAGRHLIAADGFDSESD